MVIFLLFHLSIIIASSTPEISPMCSLPDTISDSAVASTSYDLSFEVAPPHAIYLPVAYHNNPSVRMQVSFVFNYKLSFDKKSSFAQLYPNFNLDNFVKELVTVQLKTAAESATIFC